MALTNSNSPRDYNNQTMSKSVHRMEKKFNAVYEQLDSMRAFALQAASEYSFSSNETYKIELAMDEACSNIIDHAYSGEGKGPIFIQADLHPERLVFTLEDHGQPFNPAAVPEPDLVSPLEQRKERGLGLYTMRAVMDEVRFEFPQPGVNRLIMVKKGQRKL